MAAKRKNEKPKALAKATPAYGWKDRQDYKPENRGRLRKAMGVAFRVLDILDERGLSQQDLAHKMKVTRQHVNKVLKGQENMTFETIDKLERALGIELIQVVEV
ncbi:MAG TPA: helix-turn-helix transcriptional regulator [Cyclobacteriaceae bacterium]|nr:helix-turn-helix transcriptional regulator [Cyclobacteriaceae bacterium]